MQGGWWKMLCEGGAKEIEANGAGLIRPLGVEDSLI